jgi:hypothetical protein
LTGSLPRLAALAGTVTILAACASGGGTPSAGVSTSASALTPRQAILLAAKHTKTVNSFSATMHIQATANGAGFTMNGAFREQLHPNVLGQMDLSAISTGGQSIPGGMSVVITTTALYMRLPQLTQALHTSKPWVKIPLSALGATGKGLSSLLEQAQSSSPLAQTQLLSQSKDVKKVGTTVLGGVPVTEYAGTYSMAQALAAVPASERAYIAKSVSAAGIKSVRFTLWLDDQQLTRKLVAVETGSSVTETVTMNVSGYNQPVSIQAPSAAQTYTVPASMLGGVAGTSS